ncbi:syntaxin-16-like [Mercenaria mercenaria]|uniref:syntaxin-16-like n=1 Tax=Mercenaria mercenaria TaxID=6596 RepID=UPI001E1DB36B|nr:syntaxin-16-like [Mercenaria mercenaria]XP_053389120.1 syntaxin-16-like [Mercenaria mercenaria]
MATRSLTEVFILMRNNALQSRNIFSDQISDDRMGLMSNVNLDLEAGTVNTRSNRLPPEWVDGVEEIQYEMTRIKLKMKELAALHDKHLTRPAFDDSIDEEHAIEIQTQEITQMFSHCQRLIQQITARSRRGTDQELLLSQNMVMSLVRSIQEMSNNFRKSQSTYLKKLRSREERSQFFDANIGPDSGALQEDDMYASYDRGFSSEQMQLVENNTEVVNQRDKEIAHIVRSIQDLNEIFKDLSQMVVDQGTILDRIDYNIEHASVQVEKGLQQLQKAEKYQKKNRKMHIILILALLIIILIIILIATKS